jgi:uncharacterized membrane protein
VSLTFSSPNALWLLAGVPLVWVAYAIARTNFNPRQRAVQALVRSLLLALLALALARPVLSSSSSRQSVVYLVDVSHSVSTAAVETAAGRIDELNTAIRPDHWRIVAFGETVTTVADTSALRELAKVGAGPASDTTLRKGRTDLEAALLAARGELAPEHVPRLVLFSDGRATAGDTAAAIARLTADRVPVSVEPLAPRSIGDAWVDAVHLPDRVTAGAPFALTVDIAGQRDGAATIELLAGEKILAVSKLTVRKGVTPIPLEALVEGVGSHVLTARLSAGGDPLEANNTLAAETWADPRAKVLYVEGMPASARYLSGALTASGFDVTVRPAAALPRTLADLDPWDVVIVSDVSRTAIAAEAMLALTEWVERAGGGLLVAGGEAVFGDRGYRDTPIERVTPVTFERRDEPEVALVIVLDRSWSMAGASMDLTKTAAQAAVDVLSDEQSLGILTFNDKFDWDVTLRNVGDNRDLIRRKIADIGPAGHTLIFPAVEQAYLALRDAKARAKHVILLSDGRSYPGEYEALMQKMVAARITLSTVAVGPSADPELLRNLAQWGRGRAYVVADATQVPEIFVKEAKSASTPAFDEKPIAPVVKAAGFLAGVDLSRMPLLKGRTATVLKDDALELLATEDDDPLLAFWPVGLGRTAVFASDVKDRWAANWVTWRGYGPFFSSVVRALQRQRTPLLALDVQPGPIRGNTRPMLVGIEARTPEGGYRNLLNPALQVSRSGRPAPVRVQTRQVAPGRYEATVIADASEILTIAIEGAEASGVTTRTVLPDPAAEYRFRPPDEPLLRSIAASTGGTYGPSPATLANAAGDSRARRRPLWPTLVALALGLWFADLLLRRVRIFEPRAE